MATCRLCIIKMVRCLFNLLSNVKNKDKNKLASYHSTVSVFCGFWIGVLYPICALQVFSPDVSCLLSSYSLEGEVLRIGKLVSIIISSFRHHILGNIVGLTEVFWFRFGI